MNSKRILKALASLRLAVFVLLALGAITAWGTFVEAIYGDATAAQKIVYKSIWMYSIMGLLVINLVAVMVDRWPWKAKHTAFVLAHIGIIILLAGALVTQLFGVDGSLSFGISESSKHVIVSETDFTVYSSMDGSSFTKLFDREVDFFSHSPTEDQPLEVSVPSGSLKVVRYIPYALREEKVVPSQHAQDGAAVRFQLQNERVNLSEWMVQGSKDRELVKDLGPAKVILTSYERAREQKSKAQNESNSLTLWPLPDQNALGYRIYSKRTKSTKKGIVRPGDTVQTGWMGIVLRVLKYLPSGREEVSYKEIDRRTDLTTSAIQVEYNGQRYWAGINSLLKLFSDQSVYVIAYANRRIDLGFPLKLKEFKIGRYQGTMRAASYSSVVVLPDGGETEISMNEPLKLSGFTFYQASFQEDENKKPVASVLSVNRDPGRWIKYLGCLLIVAGTVHLFYFNRKSGKKKTRSLAN